MKIKDLILATGVRQSNVSGFVVRVPRSGETFDKIEAIRQQYGLEIAEKYGSAVEGHELWEFYTVDVEQEAS